jgi:hypothetical protein
VDENGVILSSTMHGFNFFSVWPDISGVNLSLLCSPEKYRQGITIIRNTLKTSKKSFLRYKMMSVAYTAIVKRLDEKTAGVYQMPGNQEQAKRVLIKMSG